MTILPVPLGMIWTIRTMEGRDTTMHTIIMGLLTMIKTGLKKTDGGETNIKGGLTTLKIHIIVIVVVVVQDNMEQANITTITEEEVMAMGVVNKDTTDNNNNHNSK